MECTLLDRLETVRSRLAARMAPALAVQSVSDGEWLLLRALHGLGAVPPSALAAACGLTRGGVTRLVDRLRARRLVVRASGGQRDGRYQTIALTGAGALLAARLREAEAAAEAELLTPLSVRQRAALDELLETLT